jgi:hypothetical protein
VTEVFGRLRCGWILAERRLITLMLPRGVAVAVMSFLPASSGIPNTELFPIYALTVIVLSIIFMTAGLAFERRRAPEPVASISASPASQPSQL